MRIYMSLEYPSALGLICFLGIVFCLLIEFEASFIKPLNDQVTHLSSLIFRQVATGIYISNKLVKILKNYVYLIGKENMWSSS